jgi:hypothetical protein
LFFHLPISKAKRRRRHTRPDDLLERSASERRAGETALRTLARERAREHERELSMLPHRDLRAERMIEPNRNETKLEPKPETSSIGRHGCSGSRGARE